MKKRILSLLLAACMLLTLMPMAALADGGSTSDEDWTVLKSYAAATPEGKKAISLAAGKYYLSDDLDLGDKWLQAENVSGDITIDLKGHVLSGSSNTCTIKVNGSKLTVQDSGSAQENTVDSKTFTGGVIYNSSGKVIGVEGTVENNPTLTLTGGTIYSTKQCVNLNANATFYADGGVIDGDVRNEEGGTITRHDDADYTTFNGSVILNNEFIYTQGTVTDDAKLTVNFVNDGATVDTQKVLKGQKITEPDVSATKYKTWYDKVDKDGEEWKFASPVLANMTLYAKWVLPVVEATGDGDYTANETDSAEELPNYYKDLDIVTQFGFSYKDDAGNTPESATLTVSGVSDIGSTKPVYVFVQKGSTIADPVRVEPDSDGRLTFTIYEANFLSGCTVFITQPNYLGMVSVTSEFLEGISVPTKLVKDADDNYRINYKITSTEFTYNYSSVDTYVNGSRCSYPQYPNEYTGEYTIPLSADDLEAGLPSVYASCMHIYNTLDKDSKHLYISKTYKPDISVVEFKDDSGKVIDVYLIPNGRSFGDKLPTLTKDGNIFDGWEDTDGNAVKADTEITGDMVLTPKWADATLVTFDPKNGEATKNIYVRTDGSLGTDMPDDPVRAGYTFVGWYYINSDYIEQEFTDDTTVFGEKVQVYAKWQANAPTYYTLTYVSNGGTEYAPERYVYGTVVTLDKVPVREGYDFTGWYADSGLTEKIDSIRMNYFKTVYAGWEKQIENYTLTYVSNGGTEYAPETYAEGTVVALDKVPTREGYVFTGWYADEALKQAVTSVEMTSDKTVYAGWKGEYVPPELNSGDHIAYVKGYDDGTVKPLNNITRSETAMMLYRLLTDEHRAEIAAATNDFTDVSAKDWYNEAVSTMAKGGYITGYVDGTFGGNNSITRAEFVAILVRFIGVVDGAQCSYSDVPADHWAYDYIATATTAGWIVGSGDGKFNPDALITRAEAMTIINRVLDRGVDGDSTLPEFKLWPDNTPDDWFYFDVIEATNSHEYTGSRPSENWISVEK